MGVWKLFEILKYVKDPELWKGIPVRLIVMINWTSTSLNNQFIGDGDSLERSISSEEKGKYKFNLVSSEVWNDTTRDS